MVFFSNLVLCLNKIIFKNYSKFTAYQDQWVRALALKRKVGCSNLSRDRPKT